MSNVNAIISEVKTRLKKYDASGVLDEDLMYLDLITAMKAFGNDITILKDDVLEIKNGKAKLPKDFYALGGAMMMEPFRCNEHACENKVLVGLSYITNVKTVRDRWDECGDCCHEITNEYHRKEHYISNSVKAYVDYKKVKWLKLGKTRDTKNYLRNMQTNWLPNEKDEIIILGNEVRTNFKEGSVYLYYRGFVTDEDGEIDIPDTPNMRLHTYLVQYLMNASITSLILNDENRETLSPMLQFGEQKIANYRHHARTEVKMLNYDINRLQAKIIENDHRIAKTNSFGR